MSSSTNSNLITTCFPVRHFLYSDLHWQIFLFLSKENTLLFCPRRQKDACKFNAVSLAPLQQQQRERECNSLACVSAFIDDHKHSIQTISRQYSSFNLRSAKKKEKNSFQDFVNFRFSTQAQYYEKTYVKFQYNIYYKSARLMHTSKSAVAPKTGSVPSNESGYATHAAVLLLLLRNWITKNER